MSNALRLILLLSAAALSTGAPAAAPAAKATATTASYVASGPSSDAELARLRQALGKLPNVERVEMRAFPGGARVFIDGEATVSLLNAAARTVGFVLRMPPVRSYAATGPTGEADLTRLRAALGKVPEVDKVELGRLATGAALRVTGVAATSDLTAAGKSGGFRLRQLGSYVVSGPSGDADLSRLRAALGTAAGVEQVEMQGLTGGATLLITGDVKDETLVAAAKSAGYALWPLSSAGGPREFRITGPSSTAGPQKLRQALLSVEGIGEIEIRSSPDGPRLIVAGGRVRPERIVAAATEANFALIPVETVSLPTLVPEAGRGTPPDYDERILEEQAKPGETAPEFTLLATDGKRNIRLSDYRGKKPVVLMFGSCT